MADVRTRRQFLHDGSLAAASALALAMPGASTARNSTAKLPVRYGLPPGLTLHHDGTIDGTPTRAGLWKFTVAVADAAGQAATAPLAIPVYRH